MTPTPAGVARPPGRQHDAADVRPRLGAAVRFVLARCWARCRARTIAVAATQLVLALGPSAQVVTITWLIREADGDWRRWAPPLVVLALLIGAAQVVGQLGAVVGEHLVVTLRRSLLDDVARTASRLAPRQLADPEVSARLSAARDGLSSAARLPVSALGGVASITTAVVLCATIAGIDPVAGLLVAVALAPAVILFGWQGRERQASAVAFGRADRLSAYAIEQLVGQRSGTELITLGSGDVVAGIADRHRRDAVRIREAMFRRFARAGALSAVGTGVLLGAALLAVLTGSGSSAPVAAGIVGVLAGLDAILYAGTSLGRVVAEGQAVAVYRAIDVPPVRRDRPVAPTLEHIDLDDVTVTYPGASRPALSHATLSVRRGEMVALVGANGAGKTTAIGALIGALDPDAGRVLADATVGPPAPEQIGLLTQEFGRYEFTVRDAVRIGRPDGRATDGEIREALAAAHLDDVVSALPDGLDTQLGEQFGGVGLSGGQWQRLALARILLRDAPIRILDEPTSAIDAETEREIFAELGAGRAGRITLVVSHRAWTLASMDRIYVLDDGRIVEDGTLEELLAAGGRFARLFREQLASAADALTGPDPRPGPDPSP